MLDKFKDAKVIFFDLMGTCVDWHSSIVGLIEGLHLMDKSDASSLALSWRQGFFDEILNRFAAGNSEESIDITHRRVLDSLLSDKGLVWEDEVRDKLVARWHNQKGSFDMRLSGGLDDGYRSKHGLTLSPDF